MQLATGWGWDFAPAVSQSSERPLSLGVGGRRRGEPTHHTPAVTRNLDQDQKGVVEKQAAVNPFTSAKNRLNLFTS